MPAERPAGTLEGNPEGWSGYIAELETELLAAQEREKALQSDEALLAFAYAYMGALGGKSERIAVGRRAYEKALAGSPSEKPGSEELPSAEDVQAIYRRPEMKRHFAREDSDAD